MSSSDQSDDQHHDRVSGRRKIRQGSTFEQQAARFYEERGFAVRDTNWRTGHKEIDLIVQSDELIVFVEVKSTFSKKFGHPAAWIDQKKRRNLTLAAQQYLIDHAIDGRDIRFDVITFVNNRLEHFPDAFAAEG
ncbi:YraN family protein [candidate division GN15 bacterium]|nr:YraN family protein [candidate division GN15 bacterium]